MSVRRKHAEDFTARREAYLDEYARWDRLAESVASEIEEPKLTPDQRSKALQAIGFFRTRFGEDWLRQVFDQAHPFMDLVWNRAPWTRVRIADLADAIQLVELLPGGKGLTDRYAQSDQQSSASFEPDPAATALGKGLIVELERHSQPGRTRDLVIAEPRLGGRSILYLEVQLDS